MKARTKKLGTRAVAMLLSAVMAFSLFPVSAGAAQVNSYHDPAENWMQASGRTNELDVNAVVSLDHKRWKTAFSICSDIGQAARI